MVRFMEKRNSAALAFLVMGAAWFVVGAFYEIGRAHV